MLEIQNTLVSLDIVEQYFCCDLASCLGECCIEGDAGAPITEEEKQALEEVVPVVEPFLLPAAVDVIKRQGVSYVDEEGDLVTSIVDGRNCVFTFYGPGGMCLCAIEHANRQGLTDVQKPVSCALYPVRITEYPSFTALNYHKWKICKGACVKGRKDGIRLYEFLRAPLIRRFGQEWYDELALTAREYLKSIQ